MPHISRPFPTQHVPAVDRAFDMLETVGHCSRGLTLSELSRSLGIPKSTAHYLICTLLARGYLLRTSDGRHYRLGLRVFDFAGIGTAEMQFQKISSPHIQELARKLSLTVQIAVLRAGEGVIIDKADWPRDTWGGSWIGRHFDLHCTAQGKALIVSLSDAELEKLFRNRGLARFTAHTICSLDELKVSLAEARNCGFTVSNEEHILGIRGIAAPVFNHIGNVIASVSVRGSVSELPLWNIPGVANEVVRTAKEISRHLLHWMPMDS